LTIKDKFKEIKDTPFQILTAVNKKIICFWKVAICILLRRYADSNLKIEDEWYSLTKLHSIMLYKTTTVI
jgi:hypothetical protein